MPQFAYRARRRSGELVEGTLEGTDRGAALVQIERLGLFPVSVTVAAGVASAASEGRGAIKLDFSGLVPPTLRDYLKRQKKPSLRELATFTQQLTNLLQSGMPLTMALKSMSHLESKGIKTEVSKQLRQEVMEGRALSDAMARQPVIFSDLYVNMVRAGESSGALVDVLRRMGSHFERFAEVQSKFISAMVYPAIIAFTGAAMTLVFMVKILPTFISIFDGMEMQLPVMTQMLVDLSDFLRIYGWWLLPLVGLAAFVMIHRYKSSEQGRRKLDAWKMHAPVVGKVIRLNLFGQFARTLSTLLENGVPVLTALKITEQIMPNVIIKEAVAKTREAVTDGKTIAQPLAQSRIFPQLMVDLVKIGEETGDVPGALRNIAETYENDLDMGLRVLTNLIEPAMIIAMALVVCILLMSVLQAMFQMTSNIAR